MIDNSLTYYGLIMKKQDAEVYPIYELPKGYSFVFMPEDIEKVWCKVQFEAMLVDSMEQAKEVFQRSFLPYAELLEKFCVFVRNDRKEIVATAALWPGDLFGYIKQRVHWIAILPSEQGKGIGKALLTKLMQLKEQYYPGEWMYVTTQSWNYNAVELYYQFGFEPYLDEQPVNWYSYDFRDSNQKGWNLVDRCIQGFKTPGVRYILIGQTTLKVSGELGEESCSLIKKHFSTPISSDKADIEIQFYMEEEFRIHWQNGGLCVGLTKAEMEEEELLVNLILYAYCEVQAANGHLFIPKWFGRAYKAGNKAWTISLFRKKKIIIETQLNRFCIKDFWEIYNRDNVTYFRDLQNGYSYPLCEIVWKIRNSSIEKASPVSYQTSLYRLLSFTAIIDRGCYPVIANGKQIGFYPVSPFDNGSERQVETIQEMMDRVKLKEEIGK